MSLSYSERISRGWIMKKNEKTVLFRVVNPVGIPNKVHPGDDYVIGNDGKLYFYDSDENTIFHHDWEFPSFCIIGKKDKNGKNIFEGDILKDDNYGYLHIFVIMHNDFGFLYKTIFSDAPSHNPDYKGVHRVNDDFYPWDSEVIGNIWDNPNLKWASRWKKKVKE